MLMHAPDWNSFTREYDWDPIFNWSLFTLALLFVIPADLYMRSTYASEAGPMAWALMLPLPAYFLFFLKNYRAEQKALILGLCALNVAAFLYALVQFYWHNLLPLVTNAGVNGALYTILYQCLFVFGVAFHFVIIRRFWVK